MEKFLEIEGFDKPTVELFETAGFLTPESIAELSAEQVHSELSKANAMLGVTSNVPSVDRLLALQQYLGKLESDTLDGAEPSIAAASVEHSEKSTTVRALTAAVLSDAFIAEHAIDLAALPRALPASAAVSTRESLPVAELKEDKVEAAKITRGIKKAPARKVSDTELPAHRPNQEEEKMKSLDAFRGEVGSVEPLERNTGNDLTKMPKEGTNTGVSPDSRKYLRGVLHKEPSRTLLGACGFVASQLLLVSSVVPVIYILFNREQSVWGLLTPLLLLLSGLIYLALARQTGCPVCRQRQFVAKACRKHEKAHRWPVVGHMLPTAVHIVLFKWFRCIFCGTSIRVKE